MLRLAPLALTLALTACGPSTQLLPPDAILPDGSRYHGEVVDGLLQGEGRLDYPDGSRYVGHFVDGQRQGVGEWQGANGEHYVGEFAAGRYDGQGTLKKADGSHYSGGLRQGQFEGEGVLEEAGQTYRGQFRAGRFHGFGILEQADGSRFQGLFVKGLPDGQGMREDEEGNQLSGHFAGGQLKGAGSYRGSEGDSYDGEFKDNLFHGKGRYQSAAGDAWSGTFAEGALNGKGEYRGSDGSRYTGQFRDWRYQGEGHLQQPDGSRYDGQFANGQFNGVGTLLNADGSKQQGTWRRGIRVRDENGQALPDPLEIGLLKQGELLDQAIAALPTTTPRRELYALTLAGDGKQSVFLREADYVADLLSKRFAAYGRITLANHRDHLADRPVATHENLRRAVQAIAERSGPEDLVFIYLTSHGSRTHELNLDQPRLQLADLPASDLADLLKPLADRDKVVVISACYSGGFIPALKDDKTLVMTAARADRVSFGCSEEADFTYFGRALFAEALQQTDDLQKAFELARQAVAEREQADGFEPSKPQIWAPAAVLDHWNALRQAHSEAP
ncbi:C13 family peptidase [Pseudomonas fulva]|uniref:Peptidase C13, legumain asparaginyl peptidase n=1 Tax=Pseudomonas fulva (strain 12-X) TaxID=743720 RepID=F6AEV2_PSEF1|nr:C13 family peptidase [Pseudomonas fulva]AEF23596.1 Peptidase C13, legumain asparaginyl peptidase [Pseudomonas fulva 12-X]